MKDDITLANIGKAPREYDETFFWRAFRDIEMFVSKILSKGPITVSDLTADKITAKDSITGNVTGNVTGNLTGNVTGNLSGSVTGGNLTGTATLSTVSITGSLNPSANGTIDLGTAALRWRTIYTSDLDLNNGVGDWTIVEGEEDLFIYNNKKGKTYKFALTEVDPSSAPAKKD